MDALNHLQKANPSFLYEEQTKTEVNVPEEIQRIWSHLKRYMELNDKRVQELRYELVQKDETIKEMKTFIDKQKDSIVVQQTRQQVAQMQNTHRAPLTQAIDRTGVAPSEVQLDKIFNTGRMNQNHKSPFSINL